MTQAAIADRWKGVCLAQVGRRGHLAKKGRHGKKGKDGKEGKKRKKKEGKEGKEGKKGKRTQKKGPERGFTMPKIQIL